MLTFLLDDIVHHVSNSLLIIDDYHVITEPDIHKTMTFFIDHLPPTLHVMLLTRSEPPLPLLRWRARGELQDIRTADLRFSLEETNTFLNQVGSTEPGATPSLSQETIQLLTQRLEGWAAGLRLLLTLQGQKSQHEIEQHMGHNSVYVNIDGDHSNLWQTLRSLRAQNHLYDDEPKKKTSPQSYSDRVRPRLLILALVRIIPLHTLIPFCYSDELLEIGHCVRCLATLKKLTIYSASFHSYRAVKHSLIDVSTYITISLNTSRKPSLSRKKGEIVAIQTKGAHLQKKN